MVDTKTSLLPRASNAAPTDLVIIVYNADSNAQIANGSPSTRAIQVSDFGSSFIISNNVPANSTSNGVSGTFCFDNSYIYVCTSNNIWKRATLNTW